MRKVRWGVLGCASFARRRTIPALLQASNVELVGVASRTQAKAEQFRAEFGLPRAFPSYETMLADAQIEAVYIPLPNGLHGEWTIRAAEAGKHIVCEKPFAADASEARRVAAVVARAGVRAMEAFMWRFHPQHLRARQAIDDGVIGAVRVVRASFSFPLPRKENVRLRTELAGGTVMDVGCYPVSASRFYFGAEPVRAFVRGDIDPEFGVDMRAGGLLEFAAGRALIDCAFDLPYRTAVEIAGEKGTIEIPRGWLPEDEAAVVIDGKTERLPRANQYVLQFEHFSRCILEGTPPRYGPDDAILQMTALDAVRRSIASGTIELVAITDRSPGPSGRAPRSRWRRPPSGSAPSASG
jgi:predicted dehydrogenase